eukprot:CAMPEP_0204247418 /NCGR_PEP_ID=MMETSP0361-20130328/98639_1 /ASSEMBLY_ACC=CAM_ASM_000343 /TAXON_ID=268821 /ORGANISM="Scrippsiella Hangoei, Strain SHTV-5" /LENGTH=187 /DNA_ID=CAMNT_0051220653 /DNA_START=32 /DNA_END=592 /DNA_ORIENTATION=+
MMPADSQTVPDAELGEKDRHGVAPVVVGVPMSNMPHHGVVMVTEQLPLEERLVLNYQLAVSCFACLDFMTTWFNLFSLIAGDVLGFFGLILLIGPICGMIGAKRLSRNIVAVYLFFCMAKLAWQVFLAIFLGFRYFWWFLWFLLVAVVQFWITKIVATFWLALGKLDSGRRKQLANYSEPPAQMVYW